MLYDLIKKAFFQFDPEQVHDFTLEKFSKNSWYLRQMIKGFESLPFHQVSSHQMTWRNPLGLAAGFDKNGVALDFLDYLGFGAIEVGTVTLKPQEGNPKPRIWRYPDVKALRNALGFPCLGSEVVLKNLKSYQGEATLGVNIGKNKETPNEKAAEEYGKLIEMFEEAADYLVVNISSPNTEGLRDLQEKKALENLLKVVSEKKQQTPTPIYLKISPDETLQSLEEIYKLTVAHGLQGIIATNTTKQHPYESGGYSGEPLYDLSREAWSHLLTWNKGNDNFDIIGVGGFSHKGQVDEFRRCGGKFFQVYTSFVYQGPGIFNLI